MLPIFADAYQEVLGRTGDSKKTGQKAIEELLDATQKGQVVTSKILPIVERIADEMSAQSIEKIRQSSSGQRNTFLNQLGGFWTKFTEGGGERGMTLFWTRMQEFGTWLESNGRKFGEQFEGFMKWGDVAYEAIKQSISFMFTGKENEVTQMLHDSGIDITGLRESVVLFLDQLSNTVMAIAKATGFVQNEDGTGGLVNKIAALTENLQEVFRHLGLMLNSISIIISSFDKWLELPLSSKVRGFIDYKSEGAQLFGTTMKHTGIALWHANAATGLAAASTYELWAGKSPTQNLGLTVGQEEAARQTRLLNMSQLDTINSKDAAARAAEASLNRYNQAFSDNTVPPMSSSFGGNTTPVQVNVSIGADAEKLGVTMEQVYVNREQAAFAGALVNNAPKIK